MRCEWPKSSGIYARLSFRGEKTNRASLKGSCEKGNKAISSYSAESHQPNSSHTCTAPGMWHELMICEILPAPAFLLSNYGPFGGQFLQHWRVLLYLSYIYQVHIKLCSRICLYISPNYSESLYFFPFSDFSCPCGLYHFLADNYILSTCSVISYMHVPPNWVSCPLRKEWLK